VEEATLTRCLVHMRGSVERVFALSLVQVVRARVDLTPVVFNEAVTLIIKIILQRVAIR